MRSDNGATLDVGRARLSIDWEKFLLAELEERGVTQRDVAQTYSYLIGRAGVGWHVINLAIRERWSEAGLVRVKQLAWKRYREEAIGREP
jgi:hypothetical protein